MVFYENKLVGDINDFLQWAIENYNYEDFRNDVLYETLRKEAYVNHMNNTKV
jgi:hypothetical protein